MTYDRRSKVLPPYRQCLKSKGNTFFEQILQPSDGRPQKQVVFLTPMMVIAVWCMTYLSHVSSILCNGT